MLSKLFLDHPRDIGETYAEHAGHALWIGYKMITAGLACLMHALLPGLFERTASNTVDEIIALMQQRTSRAQRTSRPQGTSGAATYQSEGLLPATMIEKPSN